MRLHVQFSPMCRWLFDSSSAHETTKMKLSCVQCGQISILLLIMEISGCFQKSCSSVFPKWLGMAPCFSTWLGTLRWKIKSQTFLSHQRSTACQALDIPCKPLELSLEFSLKASYIFFSLVGPGSCCLSEVFSMPCPQTPSLPCCKLLSSLSVCHICQFLLTGGAVLFRNQFSYQYLWKISHGMETLWIRRQWPHNCDVCGFRLTCGGFCVRRLMLCYNPSQLIYS